MVLGKFLAALFGLLYLFLGVQSISADQRTGWLFRSVGTGRRNLFHLTVVHDLLVGGVFLWLASFEISNLIGRTIMLWLAHLAYTSVMLGKFEHTSDEGQLQNWGCIGKPIAFLLGTYWYFLVFSGEVSLIDIWDAIEAFLDA
jgi:hypothetical protein